MVINFSFFAGVGFLFDAETAHHERSISADGRNMRSDIETLRRVAGLRLRQNRGIARGMCFKGT